MTSRSLSSKSFGGLLGETLRRNVWAFALSILCFLFTLPLPVAMVLQNSSQRGRYGNLSEEAIRERTLNEITGFFGMSNMVVKLAILALAVVCGVALFRYLHSRQQTDFYHSLPVKRRTLFAVNFIAGIIIVLPAFLICLLVAGVIAMAGGYGGAFFAAGTATGILVNVVFFLLLYAVTVLCTILCGNTIISLLLTGWAFLSGSAAFGLFTVLQQQFYHNFSDPSAWAISAMTRLSPVLQYFSTMAGSSEQNGYLVFYNGNTQPVSLTLLLIVYFLVAAAITALACVLFQCRKSERAGAAIAFERMQAPLKFWCVAVMAVTAGILLTSMVNESWLVFGVVVGGLMTHCLMEMIYAFDFRAALRHWKSFILFILILGAGIAVMKFDLTGFDRFVPEASKVKAAAIESYGSGRGTRLDRAYLPDRSGSVYADLTDPGNIENILAIARLGVDNIQDDDYNGEIYNIYVYYELSSGKKASRRYLIPLNVGDEQVAPLLREIRDSQEYITKRSPAFTYPMSGTERLRAFTSVGDNTVAGFTDDQEKIGEIIRTLREEMLAADREEIAKTVPLMHIDLLTLTSEDYDLYARPDGATYAASGKPGYIAPTFSDSSDAIIIYPQYLKTLGLLREYTDAEPQELMASDIVSATLEIWDKELTDFDKPMAVTDEYKTQGAGTGMRSVTDRADIEALLENALNGGYYDYGGTDIPLTQYIADRNYSVSLTFKNGNRLSVYYPEGKAPEAVFKKYF